MKHFTGERRRARELAVQVLFHLEYSDDDPLEAFRLVSENFEMDGIPGGHFPKPW